MIDIVVNIKVFVATLRSGGGVAGEVLRRCLTGHDRPLFGNALGLELRGRAGPKPMDGRNEPRGAPPDPRRLGPSGMLGDDLFRMAAESPG
jgi:hypothetical protein